MRAILLILALCAGLAAACTATLPSPATLGGARPVTQPVTQPVAQPASPLNPTPGPYPVTCTPAGDYRHCTDPLLALTYDYPAFLPSITGAELWTGSYNGVTYNYQFAHHEHWVLGGGSSLDFAHGYGGNYTDFAGFSQRTAEELCHTWPAVRCREIKPGVVLMVMVPRALYFCQDAVMWADTPLALMVADLTSHPTIQGFVITGPLIKDDMPLANPIPPIKWDAVTQSCPEAQKAAYDAWMAALAEDVLAGRAEPAVQARWDAFVHLAESVTGPYLGAVPMAEQTPASTREPPRYGIPAVDAVLAAVAAADRAGLAQQVNFATLGCTTEAALGGPPLCRPGEAAGTPVEGIPLVSGEAVFARADEQDGWIDKLVLSPPLLLDVYAVADVQPAGQPERQPAAQPEPGWQPTTHAIYYMPSAPAAGYWPNGVLGVVVYVDAVGIVRVVLAPTDELAGRLGTLVQPDR